MSLITPSHLYESRPTTVSPSASAARESARLSLFEEAWLQLPRRQSPTEPNGTSDIGHRASDEGRSNHA